MADWDWILNDEGPGQFGDVLSHLDGVKASVKTHAKAIGVKAAVLLDTRARHRTGDSNITVEYGSKTDAYIMLNDPNGVGAAMAIEFGWSQVKKIERDGLDDETRMGHTGLRVLRDAAGI